MERTGHSSESQDHRSLPVQSPGSGGTSLGAGYGIWVDRRKPHSPSPARNIWEKRATSTSCFQVDIPQAASGRAGKRVRSALSDSARAKAKDVRRKRSCLHCHLQKLPVRSTLKLLLMQHQTTLTASNQCDGNTPCQQCVRVQGRTRVCRGVCERINIQDAIAFKKGTPTVMENLLAILT